MRRSAVLLSGAVLWGLGCGDQADKATAPDAPVVWQLLGNRTTEVATKLAVHHDGIVMATESGLELPDEDAVRIYELRDAVWTQLGSTLRGHVRGMVEFEESVWVGGYLYESENTVLNGLARWDGERWQPEGPTRPVWSGSIVLTGYRLPGDDVSSVHTWDGVSWGNLGGRIPGEKVRAFGERLLCWSSSAILEWDGTDWQEVRKNAPGTIEDVAMLDGAVVICGRHELGGGYVAIAAP